MEAAVLKAVIVLFVKTVIDRSAGAVSGRLVFNLGQNFVMLHLVGKVAAVKLYFQDRFIEVLELWQGENLRQQLKSYRLKVNVLLDA